MAPPRLSSNRGVIPGKEERSRSSLAILSVDPNRKVVVCSFLFFVTSQTGVSL